MPSPPGVLALRTHRAPRRAPLHVRAGRGEPRRGIFAPKSPSPPRAPGSCPARPARRRSAHSTVGVGDLVGRVGVSRYARPSPARWSAGWPPAASGSKRASPWCGCASRAARGERRGRRRTTRPRGARDRGVPGHRPRLRGVVPRQRRPGGGTYRGEKEPAAPGDPEWAGRFLPVRCDVTDPGDVERAFSEAEAAFGPVEVLVSNAGSPGTPSCCAWATTPGTTCSPPTSPEGFGWPSGPSPRCSASAEAASSSSPRWGRSWGSRSGQLRRLEGRPGGHGSSHGP